MWRKWTDCYEWLLMSLICVIFKLHVASLLLFLLSTIHGRIDQVNQLLELDYQKRGGARYTALDKWTNQLNTLNQAIVSKLTWWHVKARDKKMACLNTSIKNASVLLQVYPPRPGTLHRFDNANISKKTPETTGKVFKVCCFVVMRGNRWHLFLFFMFLIGRFFLVWHKWFSSLRKKSPNVYGTLYTVF